jgi:hypothetical protein
MHLYPIVMPYTFVTGLFTGWIRVRTGSTLNTVFMHVLNNWVRGVVATNALELGIDIGSLDDCVVAGYASSIASTWQRAGRARRRSGTSCAVFVTPIQINPHRKKLRPKKPHRD